MVLSRSSDVTRLCFGCRKNSEKNSGKMRLADVLSDHSDYDEAGEKLEEDKRKRGDFDPAPLSRSPISRWFSKNYSFRATKKKIKKADSCKDFEVDQPAGPGEVAMVGRPTDSEARRSVELSIDSGTSLSPRVWFIFHKVVSFCFEGNRRILITNLHPFSTYLILHFLNCRRLENFDLTKRLIINNPFILKK